MANIWWSSPVQTVSDHTEVIDTLAGQLVSKCKTPHRTGDTVLNMKFSNVASEPKQSPHMSLPSRCWYK